MIKFLSSYKFFIWFMRIFTIPVTAGAIYMCVDSYNRVSEVNFDWGLTFMVGMVGGTFSLALFLVAWSVGWGGDKTNGDVK